VNFARSHIAAIALGLILTVLGHDALMAADPHPSSTDAGHRESPLPAHENECGPTTGVHSKAANGPDVDDSTMAPLLPRASEELTGFLPHWSVAPDHPPDVRRALLQVYRN